jgi:hypothetical protein
MHTNVSRSITTVLLALCLLVSGFSASAASIYMNPSSPVVADGASFAIDILASGLPAGTSGGALDITWSTADMTLDYVYLATTDPADNGGGMYPGAWDPVSSFFTGIDAIVPGAISGLYVGSLAGISGDQPIAQLHFTLGTGVSDAVITLAEAAVGGMWAATGGVFYPTYTGATVNSTSAVPVPAALWLFGSGLIGLAGVARRRG